MSSSSHLYNLSPELLSLILESIILPSDLLAVIIASKACYNTFLAARERILGRVVKNAFGVSFPHALGAFYASSQTPGPKCKKFVETVLDDYHGNRLKMPSDLQDIAQISRLYFRSRKFVQDYSYRASSMLWGPCDMFLPTWSHPSYSDVLRKHLPSLSFAEDARLTRAFLRFEMYCDCFPLSENPDKHQLFSRQEQAKLFLSRLPRWEIEELCCVHQYQYTLIDIVSRHLEDDFVLEVLELSKKSYSAKPQFKADAKEVEQGLRSSGESLLSEEEKGASRSEDNIDNQEKLAAVPQLEDIGLGLFAEMTDRRRDRILSHISARGQAFVDKLLRADKPTQRTRIAESYPMYGDFLPEALIELPRHNTDSQPTKEDKDNSAERFDRHNYGWTLLCARDYSLASLGPFTRRLERYFGFIFWDAHRLRQGELRRYHPMAFPSRYSAEESFAGLRVPLSSFVAIATKYGKPNSIQ